MTKKELETEADNYAEQHAFRVPYDGSNKFYDDVDFKASKEGYLAGAESREKRIAELEAQIGEMKELLEKWYNQYSDKTYTETFYQDLLRATEKYLWTDVEA